MTVQEIFNTKAVQEIETEILNLQYETEKRRLFRDSEGFAIKSLLGIRRNILHDYFVMDENYKLLLSEFNEALKLLLIDMRNNITGERGEVKKIILPRTMVEWEK